MKKYLLPVIAVIFLASCATSPHKSSVKIYIQQNNFKKAVKEGQLWVKDEPQNPEAYLWLARAYIGIKDYEKAAENLEKVFKLDTQKKYVSKFSQTEYLTFFNAGIKAYKEGKYDKAIEYLNYAIKINPKDPKAYLSLSSIYQKAGKSDKARESLKKVLELDPNNKQALYYLGLMEEVSGNTEEAKKHLEKLVSLDTTYARAYFELGVIYFKENNYEKAYENFIKAAKLDTTNANAWLNAGVSALNLKKYQKAIYAFNKYISYKPNDKTAWISLGEAYFEEAVKDTNNINEEYLKKAIDAFNEAKTLDPNNPDIYFFLGNTYKILGEIDKDPAQRKIYKEKAIEMFKKEQELRKGGK